MVVRKGLLAYGLIGLGQKYTDNGLQASRETETERHKDKNIDRQTCIERLLRRQEADIQTERRLD